MSDNKKMKRYNILSNIYLAVGFIVWILGLVLGENNGPIFYGLSILVWVFIYLTYKFDKKSWYYFIPKEFRNER